MFFCFNKLCILGPQLDYPDPPLDIKIEIPEGAKKHNGGVDAVDGEKIGLQISKFL